MPPRSRRKVSQYNMTIDWEVEKIVDSKQEGSEIIYKVRWRDWPPESDSWEPYSNLVGTCEMLIQEYWKSKNNGNHNETESDNVNNHNNNDNNIQNENDINKSNVSNNDNKESIVRPKTTKRGRPPKNSQIVNDKKTIRDNNKKINNDNDHDEKKPELPNENVN